MQIDKKQALDLLVKSREQSFALELFKDAARLRDENLKGELYFSSGSGGIFPCKITPTCSYCCFFTRKGYELEDLYRAIESLEKLGLKHFHISGGTSLDEGYDEVVIKIIEKVKTFSDMQLEINLGPSFSKQGLSRMKALGVESITSSLEIYNDELFKKAKPGDSLERRKALLLACEEEQIPSNTMILVGLEGSDENMIEHLFYLKELKMLRKLRLSRFMPFENTQFKGLPRCPTYRLACVCALARLLMPGVQISMAAGNNFNDDIPLWYLSGGGNELFAVALSKTPPATKLPGVKVIKLQNSSTPLFLIDQRELFNHTLASFNKQASNKTQF